jgi:hypothetical protein
MLRAGQQFWLFEKVQFPLFISVAAQKQILSLLELWRNGA